MTACEIIILILLGTVALVALVLGTWVWVLRHQIKGFRTEICLLHMDMAHYRRRALLVEEDMRIEELSGEEIADEFNSFRPIDPGLGG